MNTLKQFIIKTIVNTEFYHFRLLFRNCPSYVIHSTTYNYSTSCELINTKFLLKRLKSCTCRSLATDQNSSGTELTKRKDEIKAYIRLNKEKLRDTQQQLKEQGYVILQDLKDTKSKVKERVEEIVEKENIYTIPNFLCIARMVASPYLGLLIIQGNFDFALGVLGFAAVTDLLDGWIARTWESQSSKMGSFLDPMADKILIATLFLSLTYADLIPIALTSLIITRDLFLVIAGFVIRYKSLPPPTFVRYFDATHATAQLAPTFISKVNTTVQLLLVGITLAAPVFDYVNHPALQGLWYATAGTTIAAALSYILSKNTYKILRKANK
ncbi:probable cardiolipin synthase (CMP-forming) isoform X2 [Anthonomus grandis grandis]|uniref:probable cardiolipin synthase (CMP-forming) isoform X2 n=1 Tax=Anthonomus grandis grandis TaxID=2921223 RepID=UPI0021665521|nr:probable cardiolipin synthase (CMP-forming) isoform X2 [Anthonomus grandis grandis]